MCLDHEHDVNVIQLDVIICLPLVLKKKKTILPVII